MFKNINLSLVAVVLLKSVPPAAVVHPMLARPAALVVSSKESYFFLKNPNFGLGFAGAAASAAIHSCIFATSHVI